MWWQCTSWLVAWFCLSGQPFSPRYPSWRNRVVFQIPIFNENPSINYEENLLWGSCCAQTLYLLCQNPMIFLENTASPWDFWTALQCGVGHSFAPPLKPQLHNSLELMIQLQQDPQEASLMKHFGITVSRIIIKSGNKQQAFDDLVTTYYFIWLGFSNFSRCLLYVCSRCSKRRERQNICIFMFSSHLCIVPRLMIQSCYWAITPLYSQIAFHCRLIIQNKHSNMWLIAIF